jgi:NAD(P)-dependent dehydrogenase (short-subunit alcohol dehydrogenase family)
MPDVVAQAPLAQADLVGQVVVVTGGGRGIGQAIVRAFARSGASVVAVSRSAAELRQTVDLVAQEGGVARPRTVDVTDRAAVGALVEDVLAEFGQIDVLVNNAGSFAALGPVWDLDPDLWLRDLTTNLFGSFLCARAVLPSMITRRQGTIINLTGGGGTEPCPFYTGYGSSKAGIIRLTESLAAEVAPHNIRVYALGPGLVRTAMTESLMKDLRIRDYNAGFADAMTSGDTVSPDLAAWMVVFLATMRDAQLSGRVFDLETLLRGDVSSYQDVAATLTEVVQRAEQIVQQDLYTLRLRT